MSTEIKLLESKPEFTPIKQVLESPALADHYKNSNQFNMNLQSEIMFAKQLMVKNDFLMKCTPTSFYNALVNVTATGLTLNPLMQQAHLVPRKVKGVMEVVLEPDYKGLVSIMVNSGIAKDVFAHVVYKNDLFEYDALTETVVKYTPYWNRMDVEFKDAGAEHCVFARMVRHDGSFMDRVMPIHRVNEIMEGTDAYKSHKAKLAKGEYSTNIWDSNHRPEMIKKTVIRHLWKHIPKSDNMMFNAMAKAIEQHDIANHDSELDGTMNMVTVADQQIKTTTKSDLNNAIQGSIKKPEPKVNKKKEAEVIEVQEVKNEATSIKIDRAKLAENIALIADNFEIDTAQLQIRENDEAEEVKDLILEVIIDEQQFESWLITIKARNKSVNDFAKKASASQIEMCLKQYADYLDKQ